MVLINILLRRFVVHLGLLDRGLVWAGALG